MSFQHQARLPISKHQAQHIRRMEDAGMHSIIDQVTDRPTRRPRSSSAPSAIEIPAASMNPWSIPDTITETTPNGTTEPIDTDLTPRLDFTLLQDSPREMAPVSEVEALLEELNYPKLVVKLVETYRPTTRKQLLCELKKEEVRTRWALTPLSQRRPVELLKKQLHELDEAFGQPEAEMVFDDLHERAKRKSMLRTIDTENTKRNSSSESLSETQ